MRIQFQILLFVLCLNLVAGLVTELGLGTQYVSPTKPTNATDYEAHFNATEVTKQWQGKSFTGIIIIDYVASTLDFLFRGIQYLIAGFPLFLSWLGDNFIVDAEAKKAYTFVTGTICAIFYMMMFMLVIEYISGRYTSD